MHFSLIVFLQLLVWCFSLPSDWGFNCDEFWSVCINNEPDLEEEMPVNLTLAFWGDQGLDNITGFAPRSELMRKLRDEDNVQAFFHAGDFDYQSDPTAWGDMITFALGDSFPYFSAIGNHDLDSWQGGYNQVIKNRYERFGAKCWGDVGRGNICSFKGFTFIITGYGTSDPWPGRDSEFIHQAFSSYGGIWRACIWHKNQHILQLGNKVDEVGWEAYNSCRKKGAMIINGHEHSYCRSKLITDFQPSAPIYTEGNISIGPNQTFVTVSGVAGREIRFCTEGKELNEWWGSALCAPDLTEYGALVCKLNLNGDIRKGHCYFKTSSGAILDSFDIETTNEVESYLSLEPQPQPSHVPQPEPIPTSEPTTPTQEPPEPFPEPQVPTIPTVPIPTPEPIPSPTQVPTPEPIPAPTQVPPPEPIPAPTQVPPPKPIPQPTTPTQVPSPKPIPQPSHPSTPLLTPTIPTAPLEPKQPMPSPPNPVIEGPSQERAATIIAVIGLVLILAAIFRFLSRPGQVYV